MDEQREKDIQELCEIVLDMSPEFNYNIHGPDTTECPLCEEYVYGIESMDKIVHDRNCGYLIAKDLSTGVNHKSLDKR